MKKAAMLWTGGKDSCLALHRAQEEGISIACLATFIPIGNKEFKAHPLESMKKQAASMGLALHLIEVAEPYREGYRKGMCRLRDELGINTLITGDIDLVAGLPNWIVECSEGLNLEVMRPLWQENRLKLMEELLERGIQAKISWINHPQIPPAWKGRVIDANLLEELKKLSADHGVDICGENGEYHTITLNAPLFTQYSFKCS